MSARRPGQTTGSETVFGIPTDVIVSDLSQYSHASISGCAIVCLEAAFRLLLGGVPSKQLIDEILEKGAIYMGERHLFVDEILMVSDRYHSFFHILDTFQSLWDSSDDSALNSICSFFNKWIESERMCGKFVPVVGIVTKPPETVCLAVCEPNKVVIFDSHGAGGGFGAAFYVFQSIEDAVWYLNVLFPPSMNVLGDVQEFGLQGELMNQIEVVALRRSGSRRDLPFSREDIVQNPGNQSSGSDLPIRTVSEDEDDESIRLALQLSLSSQDDPSL